MNTDECTHIQGDQKVSVHLMITIQEVTSNVQSGGGPVSRHLLTRRTVFSKTVFTIARSTFRMYTYSVMARGSLSLKSLCVVFVQ
jgi:hypothetical protein